MKQVSAEACRCVSCDDCGGSGNIYVDMAGRYLGQHHSNDLETCDGCGGSGIVEYGSRG